VADAFRLEVVDNAVRGHLDKYAVLFLTGEWLEAFLWGLLRRHQQPLNVWDVHLGIVVGKNQLQNELDVTFMHRHNLNMIECKTGDQSYDPRGDILYKIEAVMHQFRAIRVRKFLATTSTNLLKPGTEVIRPAIQTRADIYQCTIVTRNAIRVLAANTDDVEKIRQILNL
jgi:hypothetical protein